MLANALAYRTLINMVPFLAFVFSFFALFKQISDQDLQSKMQMAISRFLPLQSTGAKAIMDWVNTFLSNVKTGSYLTFFILLLTSIFLFTAIDDSINQTFKIKKRRSFLQRVVLFTAILIWGPLLVGASIYLTANFSMLPILSKVGASFLPIESMFSTLVLFTEYIATYFLSYILVFFGLFLLFKIFPNTHVENDAAAFGSFFSALFWEASKLGFGYFAAGMLKSREKVFTTLAVFLVFLVWTYLTWVVVLFGAELAYVFQHYKYEIKEGALKTRPVNKLWLSFQIMLELGVRFLKGEEPISLKEISQRFCVGLPEINNVMSVLENAHLVANVSKEDRKMADLQYQPARELDQIYLGQLVSAVDSDWNLDHTEQVNGRDPKIKAENQFILKLFQNLKSEFDQYLSQRSLKEILVKEILPAQKEPKSKQGV